MSVLRLSLFTTVALSALVLGLFLERAVAATGCPAATLSWATLSPCSGAPGSAATVSVTSRVYVASVYFSQPGGLGSYRYTAGLTLKSGSVSNGNAIYALTVPAQLCSTGVANWGVTLVSLYGNVYGSLGTFTAICPTPSPRPTIAPTQAPTPVATVQPTPTPKPVPTTASSQAPAPKCFTGTGSVQLLTCPAVPGQPVYMQQIGGYSDGSHPNYVDFSSRDGSAYITRLRVSPAGGNRYSFTLPASLCGQAPWLVRPYVGFSVDVIRINSNNDKLDMDGWQIVVGPCGV